MILLNSFRVSWRNLTRNKTRFVFTLSAIVLGIIVMTSMLIAKETTSKSLEYYEKLYTGDADFFVQSNNYSFSEEELKQLDHTNEIEKDVAALLKMSSVEIDTLNTAQSSVRISGVSSFDNGLLVLPVKEGDLSKQGLVITENAAKLWNKKIGDLVSFSNMGTLAVTAIVEEGAMLSSPKTLDQANFQSARVMVPLSVLQEWARLKGKITDYRFKIKDGSNPETLLNEMQIKLKSSNLFIQPVVIDDRQNNDVEGLYWIFDIIAILSVFISGFIAFNMIYTSVIERRKEFAIMKSLGYTNGKLYRLILQEIGLLAIIGTLIALPIGVWFGGVIQELLLSAIATQEVTYTLEIKSPLIISAIVGLLFPFMAAFFPVFKAGKTSVMEAIVDRTMTKPRVKGYGLLRLVLGVIFTGVGVIDHPIAFLFLFIGLVFLYPLFMSIIQWALRPLFKFIFKYPGEQAARSMKQFNNRNANTSAMLAIGVSLALFMSAMLISIPDGMGAEIRSMYGGNLHVNKETPWEEADLRAIQEVEEITGAYLFAEIPHTTWQTKDGESRQFSLISFTNHPQNADMFRIIEETDNTSSLINLYLGERALSEWGGEVGDTMTLNTPAGEQEFLVKASIESTHYTGYVGFLNEADMKTALHWPYTYNLAISTESEDSLPIVMDQIWETFGQEIVSVSTASMVAEKSKQALTGMEELLQGLLILIIALSAIGISNTLFMNILERTKEIGMMRAIGFTKTQVRLMIIAEGLFIGLVGVIIGIGYGICIIYLNAQSEKELLSFTIPKDSLFLAISSGLLLTLIAAWLPSMIATRVSVKEAISHE